MHSKLPMVPLAVTSDDVREPPGLAPAKVTGWVRDGFCSSTSRRCGRSSCEPERDRELPPRHWCRISWSGWRWRRSAVVWCPTNCQAKWENQPRLFNPRRNVRGARRLVCPKCNRCAP